MDAPRALSAPDASGEHANAPDRRGMPECMVWAGVGVLRWATIDTFIFSPPQLTVAAGTRVPWTNQDNRPYAEMIRNDPRAMKAPVLDTYESFAFTSCRAAA